MLRRNGAYERIGYNLRKIRRQMGFMQIDVAAAADLDRTYVSRIENGKARVTLDLLVKLVRGLEISSSQLFAEEGNETNN